ncbi:DUF1127 domain-containing protein [Psychromarinibacter halotolerans]|uniref:DUF1127 domain-containing protein n=1 Tax=Psychromarinibacter halotolerans TaxID=1775175 RepID=A0ABV7GU58_9RHOB|nr:DUF1127 domain-containing protein [Psychromarinibacter halotolerans]MAQ85387.1 hypothetical protein [Maritimibacter sp.]MDF0596812.1 DUF1127 domain-containing protein [Psychromarinibacter halotolerans]
MYNNQMAMAFTGLDLSYRSIVGQSQAHLRHRRRRPSIVATLFGYFRSRRDYQRLEALPDYLLDDVGLTRADVAAASRLRFY